VILTAQNAAPKVTDFIGALLHEVVAMVERTWYVLVLLALVGLGKLALWIREERRLARSGITQIDAMDGILFERRMALLFGSLGYRVEQTKARGDYGADLVLERGGVRTVVQAKRWTKNVGLKAVQEAVAAKPMYHCSKAMVVTNRYFSHSAITLAKANTVELWDRDRLIQELLASGGQSVSAAGTAPGTA
jgi:restriction system protein